MITLALIILSIIMIISILGLIYSIYQLIRNNAIYSLREKWLKENYTKYDMYSYEFMIKPSIHNYFGLQYPTEKKFPIK